MATIVADTKAFGVVHRTTGEMTVTAVTAGYFDPPPEIVVGIDRDEMVQLMAPTEGRPIIRASVNVFIVRSPSGTILVDAGAGVTMGPTCGKMYENLAAAGISPADVDAIVLTHIHPDHTNGLTTEDGVAVFPRAELIVHETEVGHWFDDAAMAVADERARIRYFEGARFRLAPYAGRTRTITSGEVLPGVIGIPCPGHTPGHTAYRIGSANEAMLFWGDTVHVPELQVPRPDITVQYDVDPIRAVASRLDMFDLVLRDNLVVAGAHLHFPGFARMAQMDGSFRLLPDVIGVTDR